MSTKKKESLTSDHPTPDSTTKEKTSFCIGDEVLMQRKDGNFYLGTVVKIDLSRDQCQVKFGDDTETWSSFSKLTKLSASLDISCSKCQSSESDPDNDIVMCDKCARGYHQKCHSPEIGDDYLKEDAKWECMVCAEPSPPKKSLSTKKYAVKDTPQVAPKPASSTPVSSKTSTPMPPSLKPAPQSLTKPPVVTSKPAQPAASKASHQPPTSKALPIQSAKSLSEAPAKPPPQAQKPPVSKPAGPASSKPAKPSPPLQAKPAQPLSTTQTEPEQVDKEPSPSPPTPPTTPTEYVSTSVPIATEAQKKKLPYNLNDLHWDMQHRSNTENKYCYCGGPGKWFLRMLQCGRCRQWFHGRCISSLRYPLFYGDRFYVFVCTLCNSGKEFLRRLEIKWVDLVHLATFDLTLRTAKKYVDVDDDILRFIDKNWNDLQLPPKILETTGDSEKRDTVLSVLTSNRNRFKDAREEKSRKTKWGLRVRVPPPTPVFSLPPNKPLSDQVLSDAWSNSARLKFLPPPPRNSLPPKPEDVLDLAALKDHLPGVDILHIETSFLVLPKGVPTSGHNVCIKSSTPVYPESRAIKRRIKEQGMENDRMRRSRKARRLLQSSGSKDREGGSKERQELPPTPPSSESNVEVVAAQPDTSGDETSSRGTLDSVSHRPLDYEANLHTFLPGLPGPILPGESQPVLRPVKRRLSEKDIIVTSTGEVKRRKVRRSRLLAQRASLDSGGKGVSGKRLKPRISTPTTSPVKTASTLSLEELKSNVNQYFGASDAIANGQRFTILAKRITPDGNVQYLINWGSPT